ncbi:MAG: LuxR C-terminal-related transcriptional regulator [Anaerolineales bacterium]
MTDLVPGESYHWLVETKYQPPLLREDIIPRQQLLADLHSLSTSLPLTLLSAPAGYGKTTLLSSFFSSYPDLHVAWISLEDDDNDPIRFLAAFIAALQHLNPNIGSTAQSLLASPPNIGVEVKHVMSVLINDIVEISSDPIILMLDDLHKITEPVIFVSLNYLVEHMPPHMHLVVASRRDPAFALARLRARGQVSELRLGDLRFSNQEASIFLNDYLDLNLSPGDVELLQSRTEGWAVGLRLLAGSLNRFSSPEDKRSFIRFLAQTDRHIFDFLAEEVFSQQDAEVQDFLLMTSILPELTADLCKAVTELENAGTMLDVIYQRNLFLVRSDSQPAHSPDKRSPGLQLTYRYHDLFAEFLHHKLQHTRPNLVPELHLRAARAQRDPSRAVNHYLAAERWSEAAEIIERIGAKMFTAGYLDTLSRWINTLPASVRDSHPRLLHYLSSCAIWKGNWSEVQPLLERALLGFESTGDQAGQGEVLTNLATYALLDADLERSSQLFDRALALTTPPTIKVQSLLGRAAANMEIGDWEQAEQDFKAAMVLIDETGELDLLHLVNIPYFDAGFAFLPGGLEHLENIYYQAKALVGDEVSPLRLVVEEMITSLLLISGRLDEAIRNANNTLVIRERLGGHPFLGIETDLYLIVAHSIRGDYAIVAPLLDSLFNEVELHNTPMVDVTDLLFGVGRIYWLQGCITEARQIYDQMCTIEDPRRDLPAVRICRAWMSSMLAQAEGRYAEAEKILRQPEVLDQEDRRSTAAGNTHLMLARLYQLQNQQKAALEELAPVLAYHEKLGVPMPILMEGQSIVPLLRLAVEQDLHANYAAYLLDILGDSGGAHPVYISSTGETLTPREVEIMRLVIAGDSNQAIAEKLFISIWTVKSHLTKIYRKLDASSRSQAIARAHELWLT